MTVAYKDIPGFPGYRVGDDGSVWTCKKFVGLGIGGGRGLKIELSPEYRPMRIATAHNGYQYVHLRVDGKKKSLSVHGLVALAFIGCCPAGKEVAHENGCKTDNRSTNLSYKTRSENHADKHRHGTDLCGEKSQNAKLTVEQVRQIRADYVPRKVGCGQLAKRYGVSLITIYRIIKGTRWGNVK